MAEFNARRESGRGSPNPLRTRRRSPSTTDWRRVVAAAALAAVAAVVILAVPFTALARAYGALPRASNLGGDTLVYGQGGAEIADLHPNGSSRIPVAYDQIAPVMRQAVVAIEDHTFWTSPSFDLGRIIQAAFYDVVHHSASQGASTIPEQLAKILYLHDNRSLTYKVKEILFGQELTAKLSRSTLLDDYLNDVYFGEGATGIEAAALTYFGVHASQLDANQATLLAGLLPEPSYLDPFLNLSAARQRQRLVVAAMRRQGELSAVDAAAIEAKAPALAVPRGIRSTKPPTSSMKSSPGCRTATDPAIRPWGLGFRPASTSASTTRPSNSSTRPWPKGSTNT